MPEIISITVIIILCLIAFIYPPLVLFFYALAVNMGEGFGIAKILSFAGFGLYFSAQSVPLLFACAVCFFSICNRRNESSYDYNVYILSLTIVLTLFSIFITLLFKQTIYSSIPNNLTYSGMPASLIVFNYWKDVKSKILFIVLLLFHQLLSVFIVLLDDSIFNLFSAIHYFPGGIDVSNIDQRFIGTLAQFSGQEKIYAQHYNPNIYGLYSVISVITGSYIFIKKKHILYRISGVILVLSGVFGVFVTMSRGSILGLLVGAIVVLIRNIKIMRNANNILFLTIMIFVGSLLSWYCIENISKGSDFTVIRPIDIEVRLDALKRGFEVIVENPIFGADINYEWPDNITPHQIMVYFAATHGLFSGILVTILHLIVLANLFIKRPGFELNIIFSCVCLGTGLTNNFAAPILYWVCLSIALMPCALVLKIIRHDSFLLRPKHMSYDINGQILNGGK